MVMNMSLREVEQSGDIAPRRHDDKVLLIEHSDTARQLLEPSVSWRVNRDELAALNDSHDPLPTAALHGLIGGSQNDGIIRGRHRFIELVDADFPAADGLEDRFRFRRQMQETRPEAHQTEGQRSNVDDETIVPLSGHRLHECAAQRLCGGTETEVAGDANGANDRGSEKEEQDEG